MALCHSQLILCWIQILTLHKPHISASFNTYLVIGKCVTGVKVSNFSGHYLRNRSTLDIGVLGYFCIFNIRNTLPKFCPFLLGHPVYIYIYIYSICICCLTNHLINFTKKVPLCDIHTKTTHFPRLHKHLLPYQTWRYGMFYFQGMRSRTVYKIWF